MSTTLALYKGPSGPNATVKDYLVHWGICIWTLSRHSHGELCIDGVCYSSSVRDGGVRKKKINLNTGRWTLVYLPNVDEARAMAWFMQHEGQSYDWPGIVSWVIPLVRQHKERWVCFEAVGAMLGLENPHKLSARKLLKWAREAAK